MRCCWPKFGSVVSLRAAQLSLARTGRPAAKRQPEWPAYTTAKRATMEVNAECKIVDNPYTFKRKL